MSFRLLSSFRKSFRKSKLKSIEETTINDNKIDEIPDETIKRKCRQSLRIKEGANRILEISENLYQQLDAAKAVLTSNRRIQHISSKLNLNKKTKLFNKGQVTISDIKIPLIWKSYNGNKLANGSYVLFCIFLMNNEVRETQLICDINSGTDDITFSDVIQINDVLYDSYCDIEIYGYTLQSSSSYVIRRNSTKRFSLDLSESKNKENKKSLFEFIGRIQIYLSESSYKEQSYNIEKGKDFQRCDIPIFGTLSCKLTVIPMSKLRCYLKENTYIKYLATSDLKESDWISYYVELKNSLLHCWKMLKINGDILEQNDKCLIDDDNFESADLIIPITQFTKIENYIGENKNMYKISTYFDEVRNDYQEFLIKLNKRSSQIISNYIFEQKTWKQFFMNELEFVPPPTSFLRNGSIHRI